MKKIILSILLLAATAVTTQAGVVLSDFFTYPDGDLIGAAGSPWVPHSGAIPMQVLNNQIVVAGTNTQDVHADLQGGPYTTNSPTVLYSSFNLTYVVLPGISFGQRGKYIAHFKDINTEALTGFGARVWASTYDNATPFPNALPDGTYRLGILNGAYATIAGSQDVIDCAQLTNSLTTNISYQVVTRFAPSNGIARIWINPADESSPYAEGTDPGTETRPNPIDVYSYSFRQSDSAQGVSYVDNLKVGTHFYDVAGTNTPPLISSIADQSIPANGATAALAFTVQDDNTPAGSLVISNYSDNPTVVSNDVSHIVLGGSGTNRTITVTPNTGQQGLATIHVYATDNAYTSEGTFDVLVGYPAISAIANQITVSNVPTPAIAFTVGDAESAASSLTLTGTSSNPNLVTSGNIVFGGSASNRTVTLTPTADQVGITTITVFVSDGARTNSSSFKLTVKPVLGVLLTENFNYTSFPFGSGTNGLYQADGSPWQHVSGGYYQIVVTNSAAELYFGNSENLTVPLTNQPYQGTNGVVLYSGFTVIFKTLPGAVGGHFAGFRDTPASSFTKARVFASTVNAAAGHFRFGMANNSSLQTVQFSRDLALNQKYLVVTRCNFATGEGVLWVDPTTETGSGSVAAPENLGSSQVSVYALRCASGIGFLDLDNLVIAGSFNSVLTALPSGTVKITAASIGGNVVLSWTDPTGLLGLESATTVNGTYEAVLDGTNPYTNTISGEAFFRLKY